MTWKVLVWKVLVEKRNWNTKVSNIRIGTKTKQNSIFFAFYLCVAYFFFAFYVKNSVIKISLRNSQGVLVKKSQGKSAEFTTGLSFSDIERAS